MQTLSRSIHLMLHIHKDPDAMAERAAHIIADKCDELLQKIEEAAAACKTENIVKVDQITSDNVTPDDKENLVAAKEDLQNALEQ